MNINDLEAKINTLHNKAMTKQISESESAELKYARAQKNIYHRLTNEDIDYDVVQREMPTFIDNAVRISMKTTIGVDQCFVDLEKKIGIVQYELQIPTPYDKDVIDRVSSLFVHMDGYSGAVGFTFGQKNPGTGGFWDAYKRIDGFSVSNASSNALNLKVFAKDYGDGYQRGWDCHFKAVTRANGSKELMLYDKHPFTYDTVNRRWV